MTRAISEVPFYDDMRHLIERVARIRGSEGIGTAAGTYPGINPYGRARYLALDLHYMNRSGEITPLGEVVFFSLLSQQIRLDRGKSIDHVIETRMSDVLLTVLRRAFIETTRDRAFCAVSVTGHQPPVAMKTRKRRR